MEFIRRMPLPNKTIRRNSTPNANPSISNAQGHLGPYSFEPYSEELTVASMLDKDMKSNGSFNAEGNEIAGTLSPQTIVSALTPCNMYVYVTGKERVTSSQGGPMKAWSNSTAIHNVSSNVVTQVSSDTESFESSPSVKSRDNSPSASPMMPARRLVPGLSGDELENDQDPGLYKQLS